MRNEDYDRELLAVITLVCVVLAAAVSVFDTTPSIARGSVQTATNSEQPQLAPARIVGMPFVPNTHPSIR